MELEMTYKCVNRNYIDTNEYQQMEDFVRDDMSCALEEYTEYDEEEINVICDLIVEEEDWEFALRIMEACGFFFRRYVSNEDKKKKKNLI